MPVKNYYKACLARGGRWTGPMRKAFKGDGGQGSVTHNPEPLPGSRTLKVTYVLRKCKVPKELLVGLAKRPHTHPKDLKSNFGMHFAGDNHSRLVPLTRARRRK